MRPTKAHILNPPADRYFVAFSWAGKYIHPGCRMWDLFEDFFAPPSRSVNIAMFSRIPLV
jgi:hypothetical protein